MGAIWQVLQIVHHSDDGFYLFFWKHVRGIGSKLLQEWFPAERLPPVPIESITFACQDVATLQQHCHLSVHFVKISHIIFRVLHHHFVEQFPQLLPVDAALCERAEAHFSIQQGCTGIELEGVSGLMFWVGERPIDVLWHWDLQHNGTDQRGREGPRIVDEEVPNGQGSIHHPVHPQVGWESLESNILLLQEELMMLIWCGQWSGLIDAVKSTESRTTRDIIQNERVSFHSSGSQQCCFKAQAGGVPNMQWLGLCGSICHGCSCEWGSDAQGMGTLGHVETQQLCSGCSTAHGTDYWRRVEPKGEIAGMSMEVSMEISQWKSIMDLWRMGFTWFNM